MQNHMLLLPSLLPLVLALLLLFSRHKLRPLLLLAPITALAVALAMPLDSTGELPWLLLGVHLQLDETAKLFLLFSSIIWLIAALYILIPGRSQQKKPVYITLFLVAMAGNFLLILAADMLSFYLGFALMGLSAYVLILKPAQHARRAARIYLGFTLVGELALFSAILVLFSHTGSLLFIDLENQALPALAIALIVLSFGIKLALPGLHPWLPMTYTSAPLVSVAILSGPMMKAGLLGWIRFLPPGADALVNWGYLLIWLGSGGLLLGTALALLQSKVTAVLAYSSVAKMGMISAIFGYALAYPQQAELVIAALILFAMHHLLVKSSLFLGVAALQDNQSLRTWILGGLVLLSMSLIGLPFSGGLGAKIELDLASNEDLGWLLKLAGIATTLIMTHFLWLLVPKKAEIPTGQGSPAPESRAPLAWFALLPVAWWGPFMPGSIGIDPLSLLIAGATVLLYAWFWNNYTKPARIPSLFKPGDYYHLIKRIRLLRPFAVKGLEPLNYYLCLPQSRLDSSIRALAASSLAAPGVRWLIVSALLVLSLFFPLL